MAKEKRDIGESLQGIIDGFRGLNENAAAIGALAAAEDILENGMPTPGKLDAWAKKISTECFK